MSTPARFKSKSPSISRFAEGPYSREGSLDPVTGRCRARVVPPKFYATPHNKVAEEGETVRFTCMVGGHPRPTSSWDKDNLTIRETGRFSIDNNEETRVLQIHDVNQGDAGLYRITVENDVGRVQATARLEVISRTGHGPRYRSSTRYSASPLVTPRFTQRLSSPYTVRDGGRARLSLGYRGSPVPSCKWYRNGDLLTESDEFLWTINATTAVLEIREVFPDDAGDYTCVLENDAGGTCCTTTLKVTDCDVAYDPTVECAPPSFLRPLSDVRVDEGQPLELSVRLEGTPPLEVVWVKNDKVIKDCPDFRYNSLPDGTYILRVRDVYPWDSGIYICEAYNAYGEADTHCTVVVIDASAHAPVIGAPPEDLTVAEGSSAIFSVRVLGSPSPTVTWILNEVILQQDNRVRLLQEDRIHSVEFRHVSSLDSGTLTCVVENEVGSESCTANFSVLPKLCGSSQADSAYASGAIDYSDSKVRESSVEEISDSELPTDAALHSRSKSLFVTRERQTRDVRSLSTQVDVATPARVIRGPQSITALCGEWVTLRAQYEGLPEPDVRWLKAGKLIDESDRVTIEQLSHISVLTIRDITADDSGKYVVMVENPNGSDCHFASVAVEGPPEPPADRPYISGVTASGATLSWYGSTYDGGSVVTGYVLESKKDDGEWEIVTADCHSTSYIMEGLQPSHRYVFRVKAENIHGVSAPGRESDPVTWSDNPGSLPTTPDNDQDDGNYPAPFSYRKVTLEDGSNFHERFSVHEELGKGRFGIVYRVTDLQKKSKLAAKFVKCIKQKDKEKVREEIEIMNCLQHPKLLQLAAAFESPKEIIMVMEYISGGELFERVVADDFTLTERDCILFLRQICDGVRYMHESSIVHLDLKPENILCRTKTSHQIKLIDFGLAQKYDPENPPRVLFGTPEFIAPEIINYEPISLLSDMWSVGVICYVLLSGLSPFMGENDAETFVNITKAEYDFDDEAFDAISDDAKDFIISLLKKRKEKRLSAIQCVEHCWLNQRVHNMNAFKLSTDKLKKFIIRRKWQKLCNACVAATRLKGCLDLPNGEGGSTNNLNINNQQ